MSKFLDDQYAARIMKMLIDPNAVFSRNSVLDQTVLAIRKMIESLPGGSLKLRQYAIANIFLMRKLPLVVTENFNDIDSFKVEYLKMLEFVIENQLVFVEEELAVKDAMWFLIEDGEGATGLGTPADGAPANSTAAVAPQPGEPVIDKKRKRLGKLYARTEPEDVK